MLFDRCESPMIGCGGDTYDPICQLPKGHAGVHKSPDAVGQHKLEREWRCTCTRTVPADELTTERDPFCPWHGRR